MARGRRFGQTRCRGLARDLRDVLGCWSLLALHEVELDALSLSEGFEARALNGRVMDEAVLLRLAFGRDEAEPLGVVEPLHGTGGTHTILLTVMSAQPCLTA